MPKSKSTRGKKRSTKTYFSPFRFRQVDLDKLHDDFRKFEMVCELKLPAGNCDFDDLATLRDFFNLAKIILLIPEERCWLDREAIAGIVGLCMDASVSVAEVTKRGVKSGSFVCKGEELAAIRDFAAIAGEVVHRSIDECPRRLVKEYLAMKDLTRNIIGRQTLSVETVKQAIAKY